MRRHVLLTGEIGAGKSTVLRATLQLLDVRAEGIETYYPEERGAQTKTLYLRAYGSEAQGTLLCTLPDGDKSGIAPAFDTAAVQLLEEAQRSADVIVVDEIGRLEHGAAAYHRALKACLDGDRPVLGVIRLHKAPWADWIRLREDVLLVHVTGENRDALPGQIAAYLRAQMNQHESTSLN